MKKSIWLILSMALALGADAGVVNAETAKKAAEAWARKNSAFGTSTRTSGDVLTVKDSDDEKITLWHQVSMSDGGMLVVAPVTEIEPVIMALDNDPGELDAKHTLRAILTADLRRRLKFLGLYKDMTTANGGALRLKSMSAAPAAATAQDDGVTAEAKAWGEAMNEKWTKLTRGGFALKAASPSAADIEKNICTVKGFEKGGALTHWNQGSYNNALLFNKYTPGNSVCGCAATMCGALVQFYGATNAAEYTAKCSYNGEFKNYTAMPGALDWNILPSNWGGTNAAITATEALSDEAQDLLGRVAYNCGVGMNMNWTDKESGTTMPPVVTALKEVFGFKHARYVGMDDVENPSQECLEKLIYNQVRAGVPVGMAIDMHAVIAAGYGLDSDDVERVRVFMGWGGSGDGWYALPKVDTKATVEGGTYLSEIISGVVTMISHGDDDIVPVVGQVSMPGVTLSVPALGRTIHADGYGYFGTRVPATLPADDCKVTCQSKEATFAIGEAAAEIDPPPGLCQPADSLCAALPADFEFLLLNCTVAYSTERAKLYAQREGKAILHVSGRTDDPDAVEILGGLLDYVYQLDENNTDDFTNRFVYVFSDAKSVSSDGAAVSYGIFLPDEFDPENNWLANNGALTYGYADVNAQDEESFVTHTFAPTGSKELTVTNGVNETDALIEAVKESFDKVASIGYSRFLECTSGIEVTVQADSAVAEAAINADPASDKCKLYDNCFKPDESVTFTCNAEVTNTVKGVVYECAGWTLYKADDLETEINSGTESTATFVVSANDNLVLKWDFSKIKAVFAEVKVTSTGIALDNAKTGAVTPAAGWFAYDEPVTFTANDEVIERRYKYKFQHFTDATLALADGKADDDSKLSVTVPMKSEGTITIEAVYRSNGYAPSDPGTGDDPGTDDPGKPDDPDPVDPGTGDDPVTPDPADPVTDKFGIEWDDALSQLNTTTYATNIATKAQLEAAGLTLETVKVDVPKGFKVNLAYDNDDNVVAKLELDEAVLKPVGPDGSGSPLTIFSNGDGSVTVKADVLNGVRGFWYTLYGSDELAPPAWEPVTSGYSSGDPSEQATADDQEILVSITIEPNKTKKFFKLVVTVNKP